MWVFYENTRTSFSVYLTPSRYQSALLYFHGSAMSQNGSSSISFHLRSIPNKRAWDPITRSEIKPLLSGRTTEGDKIQADLFPFVSSLAVPHIPLHFPSRSGELRDKWTLFHVAKDWSHSVSYSALRLSCYGSPRWVTSGNLQPPPMERNMAGVASIKYTYPLSRRWHLS